MTPDVALQLELNHIRVSPDPAGRDFQILDDHMRNKSVESGEKRCVLKWVTEGAVSVFLHSHVEIIMN